MSCSSPLLSQQNGGGTQLDRVCAKEVQTIHEMAISEQYKHLPISRLALLAQRLGKVYASASTWARLIRERGWGRPRQRVYPAKAKVGVRAEKPNDFRQIRMTGRASSECVRTQLA